MAEIKVDLSLSSIQRAIKQLNNIDSKIQKIANLSGKELATKTLEEVKKQYSNLPFESTNENPTFRIEKTNEGYEILASGTGVIYEEFGTGDVGASNPHPNKNAYGLKGYNTGSHIRPADKFSSYKADIKSGNYWVFKNRRTGDIQLTQGIPAGMFMYNSSEWLRDNYKDIVKQKVDDVLSKR